MFFNNFSKLKFLLFFLLQFYYYYYLIILYNFFFSFYVYMCKRKVEQRVSILYYTYSFFTNSYILYRFLGYVTKILRQHCNLALWRTQSVHVAQNILFESNIMWFLLYDIRAISYITDCYGWPAEMNGKILFDNGE